MHSEEQYCQRGRVPRAGQAAMIEEGCRVKPDLPNMLPERPVSLLGEGVRIQLLGLQRSVGNRATTPLVQRVVRVNAPRRGATAAAQIPDFMDRLNRVSRGLIWTRTGEDLTYALKPGTQLDDFDRRMQSFVDRPAVVPLRMITRHGLSRDVGMANLAPVFIDQLQEAYVDLDDLLASDDDSFRLNMIHIIVERFAVPNYERRVGTNMNANFPRAHAAGLRAERDHLRERIGDATLRFPTTSNLPGGGTRFSFRGDGYTVRHDFRPRAGNLEPGTVRVRFRGEILGLDQFIARREAAARARELEQTMGGGNRAVIGP